jgi:hypothetical protein
MKTKTRASGERGFRARVFPAWGNASIAVCRIVLMAGLVVGFGCARDLPEDLRANMDTALEIRKAFSSDSIAGDAPVLADPTGYATLSGVFKVNGNVPSEAALVVGGDDATLCAPSANSPLVKTVSVGSGGGLGNVLIYLDIDLPEDDERWIHPSYAETANDEAVFDQKDCIFLTRVFTMRSTQTIKIKNSDPVGHNTNIDAPGKARFNQLIPAFSRVDYAPTDKTKGPSPVSCNIHNWMKAYIYISDHPYYAVTDTDGRFEIANLPTGVELTFRVWQERLNNVQKVKVGFDGAPPADAKWSRGKFKTTLTPEQPSTMDVVIDASVF